MDSFRPHIPPKSAKETFHDVPEWVFWARKWRDSGISVEDISVKLNKAGFKPKDRKQFDYYTVQMRFDYDGQIKKRMKLQEYYETRKHANNERPLRDYSTAPEGRTELRGRGGFSLEDCDNGDYGVGP